jgi:hypothetical protein
LVGKEVEDRVVGDGDVPDVEAFAVVDVLATPVEVDTGGVRYLGVICF